MNVKDYLEKYYARYEEENRLMSRSGQVEYLATMKYILDYLNRDTKNRILEFGAGTGRYCIELAKRGYQVDAIELTEYNLKILNEKLAGEYNVCAMQGNALDLLAYSNDQYEPRYLQSLAGSRA